MGHVGAVKAPGSHQRLSDTNHHVGIIGIGQGLKSLRYPVNFFGLNLAASLKGCPQSIAEAGAH